MKDRVSLYPGRVKLTPVSGQENTYDMVRADEPTQEGDPLSKATFLKDDTAAMFGLDANAVPDDVFAEITNCFAQILVATHPGAELTASLNGRTVCATADSSGIAVLKVPGLGKWVISVTAFGITTSQEYEVKAIAQYELAFNISVEDATWDTINTLSENGMASSVFNIGDKKTVSINGVDYPFQIIGFDHDDKTAGGKAGITFQMVDLTNDGYPMNSTSTNSGGWKNCDMRISTMATLFSQIPSDLQNVIKAVDKLTSAGSQSDTINTTSDKLFLLSEIEVFGYTNRSKSGEGSQYEYYKAGNSPVKNHNGSPEAWWERSPHKASNNQFCHVHEQGTPYSYDANAAIPISIAFCV